MRTPFRTFVLLASAFALHGCGMERSGPSASWRHSGATSSGGSSGSSATSSGGPGGAGGASSGGSSGGGTTSGSSGGTTLDGGVWTPPPPPQTPQPGGFQQSIAPLLDASGCTECHHHGRAIDLTSYPFMAGSPSDAAQQLVASLRSDMPPAPRTQAPQAVVDAVNAWVAAGMQP